MDSINWILPSRGNLNGPLSRSGIRVSIHNNGLSKRSYKNGKQLAITIYSDAMKRFRLLAGDRVLIGHDEYGIYIKRTSGNGFILSPTGVDKSERHKAVGKHVTSVIKTKTIDGISPQIFDLESIKETQDGTLFISTIG